VGTLKLSTTRTRWTAGPERLVGLASSDDSLLA
jgi:hypothetical protein